ncbi:helix-turn-helix domain-containing protein [Apilactobacillus xinyiensis]|uniref:helix-turn-helix domain-containing protein n=1 Tax=Apilactobacillus xinyiensis TaxID=2841032 RepID=UPI00200DBC72|nr:helix-turn-helix transcriptional regulator [Apilactobacillus xinyiensis]MCL0330667.1 helix-turn-helix domain-containing protein [Apilactobacillus xinyiensis]
MDNKKLGIEIGKLRNKQRMSIRQLSTYAGVSASYLSRLENNKVESKIKPSTIDKISKALHVSSKILYEKAGYNDLKTNNERDLAQMIDDGDYMTFEGKELTDEDKELLKRLLRK